MEEFFWSDQSCSSRCKAEIEVVSFLTLRQEKRVTVRLTVKVSKDQPYLPTYLPSYCTHRTYCTYILYIPTYIPTVPTYCTHLTYLPTFLPTVPTYLPTVPTYRTYLPQCVATLAKLKKSLELFLRVSLIFGQNFEPTLPKFVCFWEILFNCKLPNIDRKSSHLVILTYPLYLPSRRHRQMKPFYWQRTVAD